MEARTPVDVLEEVRSKLGRFDILVSDVGQHKMKIAKHYTALEPNTVLISNGFCAMSGAVSGAIGAWLARPERKIMAIVGDGGYQMGGITEMETAKRLNANIVVQVWVDGGYGLIQYKQEMQFGSHTDLEFGNPDFELIAKAFGWFFTDNLQEALDHDGPALMVEKIRYKDKNG